MRIKTSTGHTIQAIRVGDAYEVITRTPSGSVVSTVRLSAQRTHALLAAI